MTGRLAGSLGVGACSALLAVLLNASGLLEPWELGTRDLRTRFTLPPGDRPARDDVFLVMVTDESLALVEEHARMSWPWDRELYALVVGACARGGAAALLFDVLLHEAGPDPEALAEALRRAPPTYLAASFWEKAPPRKPRPWEPEILARGAIEVDSDGSVALEESFEDVRLPSPEFARAARGFCGISNPRDRDGVIRRYRLLYRYRGRDYPSMALAALLAREGEARVRIRDGVLTVGRASFPVEPDGTILLRYFRAGTSFPWRAAWNVINAMAPAAGEGAPPAPFRPEELAGKVVVFGVSASGLTDLRATPVSPVMPGPEIHAVALANLLAGVPLREAPRWASLLGVAILAFGVAAATRMTSAVAGGALAAGALLLAAAGATALYRAGWAVDVVAPLGAGVFSYAAASALNFLVEGRQRRRIKREFQRYVAPQVVEKILAQPDALRLEGERKTLTIFFMDFAGFTALSEKIDPQELVGLVSAYHDEAAAEIFAAEGTIDKYIGDAIMAFWNDPVDQPDHAARACRAAVGAQRRLRALAARMRERGLPEMRARIGVNTGVATVGDMGARGQVNYTAIGDEVNLASRLEGANKEFGTEILVSEATWSAAAGAVEGRELALLRVKGRSRPVRVFEVWGRAGEGSPERREFARRFEAALADFRARRFREALGVFVGLAAGGDAASEVYRALCERYLAEPPPPDWDGAYRMESK
jgi:adenylate cyclase